MCSLELINAGLGTREVENYIAKQEYLRREGLEGDIGDVVQETIAGREREVVGKSMENKLTDSLAEGVKKRQEFTNLKQRLWWRLTNKEEENHEQD